MNLGGNTVDCLHVPINPGRYLPVLAAGSCDCVPGKQRHRAAGLMVGLDFQPRQEIYLGAKTT